MMVQPHLTGAIRALRIARREHGGGAHIRKKGHADGAGRQRLQRRRAVQQAAVERHVLQRAGAADPCAADIPPLHLRVLRVSSAVQDDSRRAVASEVRYGGDLTRREGADTGTGAGRATCGCTLMPMSSTSASSARDHTRQKPAASKSVQRTFVPVKADALRLLRVTCVPVVHGQASCGAAPGNRPLALAPTTPRRCAFCRTRLSHAPAAIQMQRQSDRAPTAAPRAQQQQHTLNTASASCSSAQRAVPSLATHHVFSIPPSLPNTLWQSAIMRCSVGAESCSADVQLRKS